MLITADHGNAELMWDALHQQPHTAHTTNLVPFILLNERDENGKGMRLQDGSLADISPTILDLLHMPQPKEMDGHSLVVFQ